MSDDDITLIDAGSSYNFLTRYDVYRGKEAIGRVLSYSDYPSGKRWTYSTDEIPAKTSGLKTRKDAVDALIRATTPKPQDIKHVHQRTILEGMEEQNLILNTSWSGVLSLLVINVDIDLAGRRGDREHRAYDYLSADQAEELGNALLAAAAERRKIEKARDSEGHYLTAAVNEQIAQFLAREAEKNS